MSAAFADGRIADLILVLTLVEALALVALHRATGRGIPPARLLPTLAAGACLLVTLRLVLAGAWWGFPAASLLGAGLAHVADLKGRWGRG